jgi:hypothetical protein
MTESNEKTAAKGRKPSRRPIVGMGRRVLLAKVAHRMASATCVPSFEGLAQRESGANCFGTIVFNRKIGACVPFARGYGSPTLPAESAAKSGEFALA